MPLFKSRSKKAFEKNVKTEMEAHPGKENRAQNFAIAYSIKRRAPKKKMAEGGKVNAATEKRPMPDDTCYDEAETSRTLPSKKASGWLDNKKEAGKSGPTKPNAADEDFVSEDMTDADKAHTAEEMNMEEGSPSDPDQINAHHSEDIKDALLMAHGGEIGEHDTIVDAIMRKRRHLAEGGEVDLSQNADEEPNNEDDLSFEALKKENYSESEGLAKMGSPEDSNQHGEDLDNDEKEESLVESIRRKSKKNKYQP